MPKKADLGTMTVEESIEEGNSPFLRTGDPSTWQKPEGVSWGDYSIDPSAPLTPRQRKVAKLMAAGLNQSQIIRETGYSQAWLSRLMSNSKILKEVEIVQDRMYEEPVRKRMEHLANSALDTLEQILRAPDSEVPVTQKESAARFILEQVAGKAVQKIEHGGEVGLGAFLSKLEDIEESGKLIDVTPMRIAGAAGENEKKDEGRSPSGEALEVEPRVADPFKRWVEDEL